MNGEFTPYMEQNKGRVSEVLLWNLERPGDDGVQGYVNGNQLYIGAGYLDGVIVSDKQLANDAEFKFVPLGSHYGLGEPGRLERRLGGFDLIHLCCYSLHRSFLFKTPEEPRSDILGLTVATNGWGDERHARLMRSRFMLNIHQDEFPYIEPLRFSLAAAYGLPILSEHCAEIYPYSREWVTMSVPGCDVTELLNSEWVRDPVMFIERGFQAGIEMRRFMSTVHSFRACLEAYL
jgi:hypothetical protein